MFASILTVLFWSMSAVCANRATRWLGASTANLARILLATFLLAFWAHLFGKGLHGASLPWFILSGCVGFGFGDIALFEAYEKLGPRLTALISLCIAAPVGAISEWLWLGTTLTAAQIGCAIVILTGVALALAPQDHPHLTPRQWASGLLFGLLAALGQGGGATVSRKAYQVATAAGQSIDGGTAAYQRAIGGLAVILVFFTILKLRQQATTPPANWRRGGKWIIAHALFGPTVGVSCFQWALVSAPSGIVLPILATTPLAVIPLAYWMENDRPSQRSLVGGIIAVAGVVALTLVR